MTLTDELSLVVRKKCFKGQLCIHSFLWRDLDEVFQVIAVVGVALPRPPDAAATAADPAGRSRTPPEEVRGAQLDALQTVHHLLPGEAEPARVEMRLNLNFLRWTLKSNSICTPWIATLSRD